MVLCDTVVELGCRRMLECAGGEMMMMKLRGWRVRRVANDRARVEGENQLRLFWNSTTSEQRISFLTIGNTFRLRLFLKIARVFFSS